MRMEYVALVSFEVSTFVRVEGDGMLIDKADAAIREKAMELRDGIISKTGFRCTPPKFTEMEGSPIKNEVKP